MSNEICHIFAGPTLFNIRKEIKKCKNIIWYPPVKRSTMDLFLSQNKKPCNIAIVDGYFYQTLSISHKEIIRLIEAGHNVWGLSSIGAIRAAEMQYLGMKGYGELYYKYLNDCDHRDDEVTLLHDPDPPYKPITEPLCHIRKACEYLSNNNLIESDICKEIINELSTIWYGYRTISMFFDLLKLKMGNLSEQIYVVLEDFNIFRIKCHDLSNFIKGEVWKT